MIALRGDALYNLDGLDTHARTKSLRHPSASVHMPKDRFDAGSELLRFKDRRANGLKPHWTSWEKVPGLKEYYWRMRYEYLDNREIYDELTERISNLKAQESACHE